MRGFQRWRTEMEELFESDSFQPEGLRSVADGRWVVLGRLQITQKESGDELDVPLAHVLEQRDRKVAEVTVYSEIAAALEAVGLPA
jgi:ketosteroid isomerase-like protein